ncbi:4345_t:CDS:2 [Rhizophagus irregularis]|nr:4345_t:CDS:2 [Rhizophagus irregularis]
MELWIKSLNGIYVKQYMDIIKFQPLRRLFIYINNSEKISFNLGLEFRSETLKELILDSVDFKYINLSFISKLKCLELLEFLYCKGFNRCKIQSGSKLHLKEFKLWYCTSTGASIEEIISYLCNESLLKLALSYITPKAAETVKESCPNISSLCIQICSDSVIPFICELRSLKVLNIGPDYGIDMSSLVKSLGNHLTSVEYLFFDFNVDLLSFIYFTNYCKANLKKWIITLDNNSLCKEYLIYVYNFQKVHNSLKEFGINKYRYNWTNEELEIVDMLKNQGINIVKSDCERNFSIPKWMIGDKRTSPDVKKLEEIASISTVGENNLFK